MPASCRPMVRIWAMVATGKTGLVAEKNVGRPGDMTHLECSRPAAKTTWRVLDGMDQLVDASHGSTQDLRDLYQFVFTKKPYGKIYGI